MDKDQAIEMVRRYANLVRSRYSIERIILFSSYAKGTHQADSDVDVAVVFASVDDIIERQIELMKIRTDDELLIEPHPFSKADFQKENPVVAEIVRNGIEIENYFYRGIH